MCRAIANIVLAVRIASSSRPRQPRPGIAPAAPWPRCMRLHVGKQRLEAVGPELEQNLPVGVVQPGRPVGSARGRTGRALATSGAGNSSSGIASSVSRRSNRSHRTRIGTAPDNTSSIPRSDCPASSPSARAKAGTSGRASEPARRTRTDGSAFPAAGPPAAPGDGRAPTADDDHRQALQRTHKTRHHCQTPSPCPMNSDPFELPDPLSIPQSNFIVHAEEPVVLPGLRAACPQVRRLAARFVKKPACP